MHRVDWQQIRWLRLKQSGLVQPFASAEEAAGALGGVQAQILPAAGLALWNRSAGLTWDELNSCLYQQRSLVKLWGQRGTLHLYPSADWPLIYAALRIARSYWQRMAEAQGMPAADYESVCQQVLALLRAQPTAGRRDLVAAGIPLTDWMLNQWGGIFSDLVRRGEVCHAGREGAQGLFAWRGGWLPDLEWAPPAPEAANLELARRYLRSYGPSSASDLAYWRGTTVGRAQHWLQELGEQVAEVTLDGRVLFVLRDKLDELLLAPPDVESWPLRLLYRFDAYLLGHKDKAWVVPEGFYQRVWRPAGHINGVALAGGRIAADWNYIRRGKGLRIVVRPFAALPAAWQEEIERQAEGVSQFFGLPLDDLLIEV